MAHLWNYLTSTWVKFFNYFPTHKRKWGILLKKKSNQKKAEPDFQQIMEQMLECN